MQTPPKIPEIPAGLCERKVCAANLFQISCRVIKEVDTASVERCGFSWRERPCAENCSLMQAEIPV